MELKKSFASGLAFLTVAMMTACSNPSTTSTVSPDDYKNVQPGTVSPVTNNIYVGDAGNGKKGANLDFTINLPEEQQQQGFSTKAATDGVTQGLAANITKLRIIVTTNNGSTASPLSGTPYFDSGIINRSSTAFTSGTSRTYTISNLSVDGTYYVGVQFFNGTDNITKNATYINGGDLPIALSGAFTVSTNLSNGVIGVTPTSGVSIAAALRDGVGAKVTADVTPTNGTAIGSVSVDNP